MIDTVFGLTVALVVVIGLLYMLFDVIESAIHLKDIVESDEPDPMDQDPWAEDDDPVVTRMRK